MFSAKWQVKRNHMNNTIYELDSRRLGENGKPLKWIVAPCVRFDGIQYRIDASDAELVDDNENPFYDNLYYAMRHCERDGLFVAHDNDVYTAKVLVKDDLYGIEPIIGMGQSEDEAIYDFLEQAWTPARLNR